MASSPPSISYTTLLSSPSLSFLIFVRTLDPIATTSIYTYMFAQLQHLSPNATSTQLSLQAGILVASKTAAKCLTGLLWGRLSDKPYGGRKLVLLVSLMASIVGTVGYGLSKTFGMAIFWQVVYGSMNNTVGIIRCMVAEMMEGAERTRERERALLMLPLAGSVGQLVGPLLGGLLVVAEGRAEGLIGRYPFLAPNVVLAVLNAVALVGCYFLVPETLKTFDGRRGSAFRQCYERARAFVRRRKYDNHQYLPLTADGTLPMSPGRQQQGDGDDDQSETEPEKKPLSFLQIWTPQVIATMGAHFIIAGHISTFTTTWSVFLASPVDDPTLPDHSSTWSFLRFSGGAGLDPPAIGILTSSITALGILLQTLLPGLNDKLSVVTVWRTALCFFPFAYILAPYSALAASQLGQIPAWVVITLSMVLFITGRVGAQPAMTLLINSCVPSPDARGTINVAGTVVGNLSRSIFPLVIMSVYGWGYDNSLVVLGFWIMSALAFMAIIASRWVKDKARAKSAPEPLSEAETPR